MCSALGVVETVAAARARTAKKVVALSPWEQAEQGRDALEAMAEGDRTRADYTRVMDGYRAIYHAHPADVHAAAAVNAVAELLAEQGRGLHDAKSLNAAVGQYEFLRKQYPANSLRVQALLAEGEIEQDDLGDAAAAKEKYQLLLKTHPKSEQAEEAKAGLESLEVQGSMPAVRGKAAQTGAASNVREPQGLKPAPQPAAGGTVQAAPITRQQASAVQGQESLPAMPLTSGVVPSSTTVQAKPSATPVRDNDEQDGAPNAAGGVVAADAGGPKRSGKRAAVTGIRHWSTATYTRVAIDLGDNVTYEAARVPNPDRIYFDLHGTRLAPELVGKSFAVTDDGFLKKVRAAQYSDDVTRVVLDVNDVTEYSAFLLPNPYRLIIDIHGKKAGPVGVTIGAPQRRADPAPTVPNTIAVKQASSAEVAAVSDLPGRVEATSRPTSQPISAVVVGNVSQPSGKPPAVSSGQVAASNDVATVAPDAAAAPASVSVQPDSAKKTRKSKAKAADGATSTAGSANAMVADATPARAAVPTADGETSLVRALGLKIGRIVIDAGHGGHDSGTLGADGIQEKDVVLDVALRLGKLLHDRLGAEIVYTRSDDTFIPLETRTAIANKAQADLFISIHANSSQDASARGVETYYLNFTSDPTALDVAARENAVSDQSIHQLSDLVKKIALKDKIEESREFASDVEGSLYAGLAKGNAGLKDRGVKKAPFVVLIGANMPSILAEISFVTNSKDAEQLQQPEYRERVAESLYKGVARYEGGLSGTRMATERAAAGQ
jgi:N-acetylmuramoyl-L-alanine amidase